MITKNKLQISKQLNQYCATIRKLLSQHIIILNLNHKKLIAIKKYIINFEYNN